MHRHNSLFTLAHHTSLTLPHQLSLAAWSSLLPVDTVLHVIACALSSLRQPVTCSDIVLLCTCNILPFVISHASLHPSVHPSLTLHNSPLRPRHMPTPSALAAGAAQVASLLQLDPPSPPLPALVSRFAFYLQVHVIARALSLLLFGMRV